MFAEDGAFVARLEQVALGVKREVDGLDRYACGGGDVGHAGPGVPVLGEQLVRRANDPQPRLPGVARVEDSQGSVVWG